MMSAMIIIGLAQSISSIMSDGKIIDTVVHWPGMADLVAYDPASGTGYADREHHHQRVPDLWFRIRQQPLCQILVPLLT